MKKHQFTAVYKKTGKWVSAWVEEVPGANTQGKTLAEARENLREALSLMVAENAKIVARSRKSILSREMMTI